jgi:Putative  PD-(D/E)XK family member, (DUF4420)
METCRVSRLSPDIWVRLSEGQVQGEQLWVRQASPDQTDRLLAAVDPEGLRHLLIRLTVSEVDCTDTQSRGIIVTTREFAATGGELGRYIDIVCSDPSGHSAFDLIGEELADRMEARTEEPADTVKRVLAKWRRFWGDQPRTLLSRSEQIGLFAELWFMHLWLVPRIGATAAAERWRGPLGSRHDFEWPGRSTEVKGTSTTRGIVHRINGLDQLVPPVGGSLMFFSLRVREEAGAHNTLPSIVSACRLSLADDDDAIGLFESRLHQAGYSPVYEPEYEKFKLRIVAEGLYRVEEDFPRITPAAFHGAVPPGVELVEYEINLSGFERLRIAVRPSDPFPV